MRGFGLGDEGGEVERLQRQLAAYGYAIAPTGRFCEDTAIVVTAFQRHFRPALVNGRADHSTIDTLDRLLACACRCLMPRPPWCHRRTAGASIA